MADDLWRPDGRRTTVQELVSLYQGQAKTPIPTAAFVTAINDGDSADAGGTGYNMRITTSSRDCEQVEINSLTTCYHLKRKEDGSLGVVFTSDALEADASTTATVRSNSGSRVAAFKSKSKDGKEKDVIDIIVNNMKEKSIDLDVISKHGKVVTKTPFAAFSWSPDESQLLFVAEKKETKSASYFKPQKLLQEQVSAEPEPQVQPGNEYLFREDWGEALAGVSHPVVVVLNTITSNVLLIDLPGLSLAEPQWIDDKNIVFVGYEEEPRRLGIIYCTNRASKLFTCTIGSDPVCIFGEAGNMSVRCPRVAPGGNWLVFLYNGASGPHHKACKIGIHWPKNQTEQLIDLHVPEINGDLYIEDMPRRCWGIEGAVLMFSANTNQGKVLLAVSTFKKRVIRIPFPKPAANLLDFGSGVAVVSGSAIDSKPVIFVSCPNLARPQETNWIPVPAPQTKEQIVYQSKDIASADGEAVVHTMLVSPVSREDEPSACFVMIHGGPHSGIPDGYYGSVVMFAKLGFKSLIVNYRGSSGFDEDFLNSLPGKVGDFDVKDCITAVDHYVAAGVIDKTRLILWGGSHGGFLVTHLSGQYPEYDWLSVVTRNPVIDLTTLIEVSDIPDWTAVEALGHEHVYDEKKLIDVNVLFDKSPYKHIDRVKAATLMLVGSEDKRVPMSQGLKWYRGLKARGVDTKCHVYSDKHDLYTVNVDSDVFVNSMIWILSRLGPGGARK